MAEYRKGLDTGKGWIHVGAGHRKRARYAVEAGVDTVTGIGLLQ